MNNKAIESQMMERFLETQYLETFYMTRISNGCAHITAPFTFSFISVLKLSLLHVHYLYISLYRPLSFIFNNTVNKSTFEQLNKFCTHMHVWIDISAFM